MSGSAAGDCWNRIGVGGDGSCPDLAAQVHCRNCPTFEAGGRKLLERLPPPDYLAEWARVLAGEGEADPFGQESVMVFRLGAEWLALPAALLVEIAPPCPVRRIPRRDSPILLGLVNIRGEILLCVSLARLLTPAGPAPGPPGGRLMVVRWEGRPWVFPVDEVLGLHRLRQAELRELPATVAAAAPCFTRRVLPLGDRQVGLLDPEVLFAALARGTA